MARPVARKALWKRLLAPLAIVGALLLKFKAALFVIFKIKIFATAGSMLVSIGAYALIWPWQFAVGLVLLLFVHELGHVIEAKRQGIPISGVYFVPFMGAVMLSREASKDAAKGAWLGLAGPILGSAGAFLCWGIGIALGSDLFTALAFVGFILNLFNLIPVPPLDGGYATAVFHPTFWLFGMGGLVAMLVIWPNPILIIIVAFAGFGLWNQWKIRKDPAKQGYFEVSDRQRATIAVVYLGLAGLLALSASATHLERSIEGARSASAGLVDAGVVATDATARRSSSTHPSVDVRVTLPAIEPSGRSGQPSRPSDASRRRM